MTRATSRDLHLLALLLILAALAAGCAFPVEPDYCYRTSYEPEMWYCEGSAQLYADTLPDDLKGEKYPEELTR